MSSLGSVRDMNCVGKSSYIRFSTGRMFLKKETRNLGQTKVIDIIDTIYFEDYFHKHSKKAISREKHNFQITVSLRSGPEFHQHFIPP